MNRKDLVWTFSSTLLAQGVNGTFSLEYHVPHAKLKLPPDELIDSRLWLVTRIGNESYLFAVILPAMLEKYREGAYINDYLMHTNAFGCVRFLPRRESKKPWSLPASFSHEEAIRECTDEERALFAQILTDNYRVGFASPSNSVVDSVPKTKLDDVGRAVPDQLALTLRTVALGDVSRPQALPESVSALGGIALTVLKRAQPNLDFDEATRLMGALDPLRGTREAPLKDLQTLARSFSELPPMVDTFLER